MDSLFLKIDYAENRYRDAQAFGQAIIKLSDNQAAVDALLDEYHDAILDADEEWRAIEQSAEYRKRYTCRDDARADFLRWLQRK